jgi:hypothetical protein
MESYNHELDIQHKKNTNTDFSKVKNLTSIFLLETEREVEKNVNQNCINMTVWNTACGTAAQYSVTFLFVFFSVRFGEM